MNLTIIDTKKATPSDEWQREWLAFLARVQRLREIANKLDNATHEQGWALAASVGIYRNGCALHNASIDDNMTGWCAGNPERLRVAKIANAMVEDWTNSRRFDHVYQYLWNRIARKYGMPVTQ